MKREKPLKLSMGGRVITEDGCDGYLLVCHSYTVVLSEDVNSIR